MIELILSDKENGQRFSLENCSTWTIGRADDCSIFLNNPGISRHHCRITRSSSDDFSVDDFGSSAGTFVNNTRISSNTALRDGDELRLGELKLVFSMPQIAAQSSSHVKAPRPDLTIVGHVEKPAPSSGRGTTGGSPNSF